MDRPELPPRMHAHSGDGFEPRPDIGPPIGRPAPVGGRIVALLGPTNTGKTFFAMERMLAHPSGMIGFPLRLLARENYDRAVTLKGWSNVALITGEEKIQPPNARYWICTVEAMPLDQEVDFLAVDEIQMAGDPERGRVFTERLLNARGKVETIFLGAETAKHLVRSLAPRVEVMTRPRLSKLSFTGYRKISRLPRRSAVVAFSIGEVYRLAELARRQRGGAAVVMGALSPRARNAQVALYQEGEVDYLIATDAIGMGLNMDVSHVAFAGLSKFDGNRPRRLTPAEIGQIAGRAGRSMQDGGFGPTGELLSFDEDVIERVEEHRFQTIKRFYWRNDDLDFRSLDQLKRSLERPSPSPLLARGREGDDAQALAALMRDADIAKRANGKNAVSLLWDVCQIPDFRKTLTDSHARMLGEIYLRLLSNDHLDPDWAARHIDRLDRTDGDIDLLMARIAGVRVWTYISHRAGWLPDPTHWQERARSIEDSLSDALHERLTQRFVDRRSAALVRKLSDGTELLGGVDKDAIVIVEGSPVGRLEGFRLRLDGRAGFAEDRRTVRSAALRIIASAMPARVARFVVADDSEITIDDKGRLHWDGGPVAALKASRSIVTPEVELIHADILDGQNRRDAETRAQLWLNRWLDHVLAPLTRLAKAELSSAGRGLAFQLEERLGWLERDRVTAQTQALTKTDRKALAAAGYRIGRLAIWAPALLRGRALKARRLLLALAGGSIAKPSKRTIVLDRPKATSEADALALAGFMMLGPHAVRIDAAERLASTAHSRATKGPFSAVNEIAEGTGLPPEALPALLQALGFKRGKDEGGGTTFKRGRPRRPDGKSKQHGQSTTPVHRPDSPFAALKDFVSG
ncbi:MAG: helicase-related protein [Alphaproteobacteria bacterium]